MQTPRRQKQLKMIPQTKIDPKNYFSYNILKKLTFLFYAVDVS